MTPALAGGFLTTAPPGKSLTHDFIMSCVHDLENIGSLIYADLPIDDTFHYTIPNIKYQKNHICYYHHKAIRKVFRYREAVKLTMAGTGFSNFRILVESLNFTIGNKYCQLFSLK